MGGLVRIMGWAGWERGGAEEAGGAGEAGGEILNFEFCPVIGLSQCT